MKTMTKLKILLSDTHFGVKNNSLTWLKSQTEFIEKQLIPYIKSARKHADEISLYHLGDVFDSRSSINVMVLFKVNELLSQLAMACDKMIILGGNHDYYSPSDTGKYNVNSIDWLELPENCTVLSSEWLRVGDELFLPWFWFNTPDRLEEAMKANSDAKIIYTHADLTHLNNTEKIYMNGRTVFSGHIHTPCINGRLYTLGSCYAITFADANQERGFYTMENLDPNTLEFHPNTKSIKFHRLHGEEFKNAEKIINPRDYVELYMSNAEYSKKETAKIISKINDKCTCNVVISTTIEDAEKSVYELRDFDIIDLCREHVPEHLSEKFNKIAESIKN